jgi:hypothetical protein
MTRPTDIPEQTWLEAERRAKEWGKEGGSLAKAIARAILDEQDRIIREYRYNSGPENWDYFSAFERKILGQRMP